MPDTPVHTVGHVLGAGGGAIVIGADRDTVVIAVSRGPILLGPAQRSAFLRFYFDAECQAEDWATQNGGGQP